MNEFRELLHLKYGKNITELMLGDSLRINLKNQKKKLKKEEIYNAETSRHNKDIGGLVTSQLINLSKKGIIDEKYMKEDLGIEFSGWIGEFEPNRLDYMIVGQEPHLVNHYIQVAYNFGSYRDWSNLKIANHHYKGKYPIMKNFIQLIIQNNPNPEELLLKLYITDLCHFAPINIGTDSKIESRISDWVKIRKKSAALYLKKEIEIVSPKIIIAQGKEPFYFICELYNLKSKEIKKVQNKDRKECIRYAKNNSFQLFGMPPIGSGRFYTFWNKRIKEVNQFLINESFI